MRVRSKDDDLQDRRSQLNESGNSILIVNKHSKFPMGVFPPYPSAFLISFDGEPPF